MEIGNISGKSVDAYVDRAAQSASEVSGESFEARLNNAMKKKDDKELKSVCQQFESIMLSMVYKQMKASIPKSGFLDDDSSTEIFQSMLDDELMEEASKNSNLGLADIMYKQLSKQMGSQNAANSTTAAVAAGSKAGNTGNSETSDNTAGAGETNAGGIGEKTKNEQAK